MLIAVNTITGSIHRYDVGKRQELLPVLNQPDPQKPNWSGPGFVSAWTITADGLQIILGQYESLRKLRLDGSAGKAPIAVNAAIQSVAAGDSGSAFVALEDGTILRWESGGSDPVVLTALPYSCTSLLYIPERKWVLANSADGSIRFLNAVSGQVQMSLVVFMNGTGTWPLWSPSGYV